ncbi:MAG: histidine phosphatase family protein [Gammaproteobacteria bacterium]
MANSINNSKRITIDLIRHGEPEGGDIVRGRVNPVLTETGWRQMQQAVGLGAECLPSSTTPGWTHLVSSPLLRCQQFAARLGETAGLDVAVIEDWQEIDYGDWDGMPATEWRKIAAEQFRAFRQDLSALAPPNGENFLQFRDRVLAAWNQLSQYEDGAHLLLVTHGGVMRVILPTVLGMPLNRSFPLHIPFACFSRVVVEVRDDKTHASLVFHNAAEHDSYPA